MGKIKALRSVEMDENVLLSSEQHQTWQVQWLRQVPELPGRLNSERFACRDTTSMDHSKPCVRSRFQKLLGAFEINNRRSVEINSC